MCVQCAQVEYTLSHNIIQSIDHTSVELNIHAYVLCVCVHIYCLLATMLIITLSCRHYDNVCVCVCFGRFTRSIYGIDIQPTCTYNICTCIASVRSHLVLWLVFIMHMHIQYICMYREVYKLIMQLLAGS